MKTLISLLATITIVCMPKHALSAPASFNQNNSFWNYDPVPLVEIIAGGSPTLSMNNFDFGKEYKIIAEVDAPFLVENVSMTVDNYFVLDDSPFTFNGDANSEFEINYNIILNTVIGQTQLLRFKIYKKVLGLWNLQTTFYYYVNTTCYNNFSIIQDTYPVQEGDYEVTNILTVSSSVHADNGLVEFDGGASVTLLPGFTSTVATNGAILVINDGCGGAYRLINPVKEVNDGPVNIVNYKNDNISVYPNPTSDLISIIIPNAAPGEKIKIETRDINGRILFSEERTYNENSQLDLKDLKPGLYFITISGSDLNYNQKIIKQ